MTTNSIHDLIDEIVVKKFVSLDAADAISAIKRKSADLIEQNRKLQEQLLEAQKRATDIGNLYNEKTRKLDEWEKREAAIALREKEIIKLELTATFANEKTAMAERLFGMVFRNAEVRRTIHDSVIMPPPSKDQYGQSMYPSTMQITKTETTEQT